MSEQDNEQTEAPVAAPISADSFREVAALLTLVTETRACKARLRELRQTAALADKARAELAASRAEHDATMTREREELAEEKARIAQHYKNVSKKNPTSNLTYRLWPIKASGRASRTRSPPIAGE